MVKPENFNMRLYEMTSIRNVKTNLKYIIENKETTNSSTVIVDKFNREYGNFATTVDGPTTQKLKDCNKKYVETDDKMFAFRTDMTEVFKAVDFSKNNKAVAFNGVSAEVLKASLPVIISFV